MKRIQKMYKARMREARWWLEAAENIGVSSSACAVWVPPKVWNWKMSLTCKDTKVLYLAFLGIKKKLIASSGSI